eukprot:g3600.t1
MGRAGLLALLIAGLYCAPVSAYDAYLEDTSDMAWVYNTAWGSAPHKYYTTKTGLRFRLLEGKGEDLPAGTTSVSDGDQVKILYKLFRRPASDATASLDWKSRVHLYSRANAENAFDVTLGSGSVVAGLDEGIKMMVALGKSRGRFLLPSTIAYGKKGAPGMDIPSDAELEYFLEILKMMPKSEL